jgi:hypothetical protein
MTTNCLGMVAALAILSSGAGVRVQPETVRADMIGGGTMTVHPVADGWQVSVSGPRRGLATLCVASDATHVRILHASAAIGEATYVKQGAWVLRAGFDFALRDSARTGTPGEPAVERFFAERGWVANPSHAGDPRRVFRLSRTDTRFVAAAFLATDEPMALSYWPANLDDDCRAMAMSQGPLPDSPDLNPLRWHRLD